MQSDRISLTLPLAGKWLDYVHRSLKRYAVQVGFPPTLTAMLTDSVLEVYEELLRLQGQADTPEEVTLRLEVKGEAVVVAVEYDRRIPLTPHETGEYEVPDLDGTSDALNMDNLWLLLIKKRMDRVRFRVQGSRHILELIKYRRDEGKEKQTWVMAVTPKLKKGLILHLSDPDAEHPSSVLQAVGRGVLRLGPSETFLIRNMDGETSFHDLYMAHFSALGMISPGTLANLYERLESNSMLAEQGQIEPRNRVRNLTRALAAPNLTIPRADETVTAVYRAVRFLFTPAGVNMLLLAGLSGLIPLFANLARFRTDVAGLEETFLNQPVLLLPLYGLTLLHIMLHELGHGTACKHFGGQVPRLGAMFYLGSLIFYCDTTASWNFPSKRDRILVSLAGPLVSFPILGAGLWAASLTAPGSAWASVWTAFCLLSALGLAMNFNPFIRMDAYYMLLDATGIPNLRKKSFEFLKTRLLGPLGLGSSRVQATTPAQERIFLWYGVIGAATTGLFLALPLLRLGSLLHTESASEGRLFLITLLGVLTILRLGTLAVAKLKTVRNREYKLQ